MKLSSPLAFINPVVAGAIATIGFGGTVGLGTVWMRHQISVVADDNRDLEQRYREVQRQIADTSAAVEEAMSLDRLRDQNDKMQLGLVAMTPAQIFDAQQDIVSPLQQFVAHANQQSQERDGLSVRLNFTPPTDAANAATPADASAPTQPVTPMRDVTRLNAVQAPGPDLLHLAATR